MLRTRGGAPSNTPVAGTVRCVFESADTRHARARNVRGGSLRILVSIEPCSYGQAIGNAIRELRPRQEVVVVEPEDLVAEAERLRPGLLFSHLADAEVSVGEVQAWVELPVEPDRPSAARVDGRVEELTNPDEAERRYG